MEKAHCFVIPSSFKEEKHQHYRYSFPTKLPELIASGRPILSYGPKETATNRILKSNNLGLRIHDRSIPKLVESLEILVSQYQESVKKFASFSPTTREKFSADGVRRKLKNILSFNWRLFGPTFLKSPLFVGLCWLTFALITFTSFIIPYPWATITGLTFGKMMPTTLFQKSSSNRNTQISFQIKPSQTSWTLVPTTAISAFGFNPRGRRSKSIRLWLNPPEDAKDL